MEYRVLRGSGLEVSRLSLGTMTFGDQTNEDEASRIVDYALNQGINFIDTADVYNGGRSEEILGRILRGRRHDLILSTKVFGKTSPDRNSGGLNRRHILNAVDASLKRLQTDYIDIYYLHSPDYATTMEETLSVMTDLQKAGKIRYLGMSNFAAWQMAEALWIADKRNFITPLVSQNVYNLITRDVDDELLPFLDRYDIGMAVYNPIAAGLLSGKYTGRREPVEGSRFAANPMYANRYWSEMNLDAADQLAELAAANNMSILEMALKWVALNPVVDTIITGVSKLEQLEQNIEAFSREVDLDDELLTALDELWDELSGHRFKYNR